MAKSKQLEKAKKLITQGERLYQQNRFKEAIKKWKLVINIYDALGMEVDIAHAEMDIGRALHVLNRVEDAMERYEAAKPIFERFNKQEAVAITEWRIGVALYSLGRPDEALEHYERAKSIFERFDKQEYVAEVEMDNGVALRALNKPFEAMERYEAAKLIFEKLNKQEGVADAEMYIGNASSDRGFAAEALEDYEQARSIYEKLDKQEGVADAEKGIGNALRSLGRPDEALEHYERAKSIYEKLKIPKKVARAEESIGFLLSYLGRSAEALRRLESVKGVFRRFMMEVDIAHAEMDIGRTLYALNRVEDAMERYEAAKLIFEKLNKQEGVADAEKGIGNALRSLGRPDEALEHYERAKSVYEKLKMPKKVAGIYNEISQALRDCGEFDRALRILEPVKLVFERLGMQDGVAAAEMNIGNILRRVGRTDEAVKRYEIAIGLYRDIGLSQGQADAYTNIGTACMALGDYEHAVQALEKSLELMEKIRMSIRSPELRRSLKEHYRAVCEGLCEAHLALWQRERELKAQFRSNLKHLAKALNNIELAKCSSVAESLEDEGAGASCPEMMELVSEEDRLLKVAQLNYRRRNELRRLHLGGTMDRVMFRGRLEDVEKDYDAVCKKIEKLRSEVLVKCADVGSTPIPRTYNVLAMTLRLFPKNERWNILEFALSFNMDKFFVFLIDEDGLIQCIVHDVNLGDLKELAWRCQGIVEKVRNRKRRKANEELFHLSRQLYATLIPEKIGKALKSRDIEHLIVVPHKFLHWVPFEALFDGDSYWGLKYAISTNFSLDLARLCVQKRKERSLRIKESPYFFLVKNPLLDLKGADKEVDNVVNLLEAHRIRSKILDHEKATQPALIKAANESPFNVLVYAGHAVFMGKNPSLSSLYLHTSGECLACSEKQRKHTPELLAATEIIHNVRFKRAPIVYLSGCESGVAEVEAGDEMFGLVRALMYAGATSLVLSRWLVRDKIAPVFAEEFYGRLLGGESVAVALQNARQKVFNLDSDKFTDWTVFSLQGDPFRRLA